MNSHVGSLARFRNKHTLSIEPFSSKSDLKKRAVSMLTWDSNKQTRETPNKSKASHFLFHQTIKLTMSGISCSLLKQNLHYLVQNDLLKYISC